MFTDILFTIETYWIYDTSRILNKLISNIQHGISKFEVKKRINKSLGIIVKYDLQERLIAFSVRIINLSEQLPETKAGKHISSQILRSGTSPAPNYGEAQSAESKADFIHKLKIALKELRETEVWLKVIIAAKIIQPATKLLPLLQETDELI